MRIFSKLFECKNCKSVRQKIDEDIYLEQSNAEAEDVKEPFISFVETFKSDTKRFKLIETDRKFFYSSSEITYQMSDALNGNIFTLSVNAYYNNSVPPQLWLSVNGIEYSTASYADKSFIYREIKNYYTKRLALLKQIKQGRLHQKMLKEYVK